MTAITFDRHRHPALPTGRAAGWHARALLVGVVSVLGVSVLAGVVRLVLAAPSGNPASSPGSGPTVLVFGESSSGPVRYVVQAGDGPWDVAAALASGSAAASLSQALDAGVTAWDVGTVLLIAPEMLGR